MALRSHRRSPQSRMPSTAPRRCRRPTAMLLPDSRPLADRVHYGERITGGRLCAICSIDYHGCQVYPPSRHVDKGNKAYAQRLRYMTNRGCGQSAGYVADWRGAEAVRAQSIARLVMVSGYLLLPGAVWAQSATTGAIAGVV